MSRLTGRSRCNSVATWLLIVIGTASVALTFQSLAIGGIGWDSRFDTDASRIALSTAPNATLSQAYEAVPLTSEFYGTLVHQAANMLFMLRGGATESGSTLTLNALDFWTYRYQGLVVVLLALIAISTMSIVLSRALGSRLAGAFFWALTLSTPLWLGMSHVDFKDIPVAAGLTMFSAALILSQLPRSKRNTSWAPIPIGAVGASIAMSVRPGSAGLLLALSLGSITIALIHGRVVERSVRSGERLTLVAVVSLIIGFAFTLVTNPIGRLSPVAWMLDSIRTVRSFPWEGTIRTAGTDVSSLEIPLWYIPAWLVAQLPLLTLVVLIASFVLVSRHIIRNPGLLRSRLFPAFSPVLIQGLLLPLLLILSGAVLYDGIRHVLFIIPALLALVAISVTLLGRWSIFPAPWVALVPVACVVVVGFSFLASLRWSPYAYAFINPVAGLWKGGWELDYWGVSAKEGVTRLHRIGFDTVRVAPEDDPGAPWGAVDVTLDEATGVWTGLFVFRRGTVTAEDYNCMVLFEIRRDGQLLGEGAKCPPSK